MHLLFRVMCWGLVLLLLVSDAPAGQLPYKRSDEEANLPVFMLQSQMFQSEGVIPVKYSCRGADVNPPLSIFGVPAGTKSLALTVHDPEGNIGLWSHWLVFNIRPDTKEIGENTIPGRQALNDFGNFNYGGPCPADEREHRFIFTLYALDAYLTDTNEGATLDTLKKAMDGKIIAQTELVGVFQNVQWEGKND